MPTSNVYNASNNQIGLACSQTGANYDCAGNLIVANGNGITYDAESRQTGVTFPSGGGTKQYVYDGDGKRVEKVAPSGATTVYVYDAKGELAAEYFSRGAASTPCLTCYMVFDNLGTAHLVTDHNGNIVSRHDYLPFGGEIAAGAAGRNVEFRSGGDVINQKFTGKERDTESGLDYLGARYYGSALGRFTSPDNGADQHPIDPQSWNLYSYVRNNPLVLVDPGGNYVCGHSMTDKQCDLFQNTLVHAQAEANKIADKYGTDSKQFQDAQRAIDTYGPRGEDNGVTINVGVTAGYPATTTASNKGQVTDENPTGQNIQVTLNAGLFNDGISNASIWTVRHEGSHVANAEQWADNGFSQAANPTNMDTEFRAYGVTSSIAEALGSTVLTGTAPPWTHAPPTTFWRSTYLPHVNDALTRVMIKRKYTNWAQKAFQKNTEDGGQK